VAYAVVTSTIRDSISIGLQFDRVLPFDDLRYDRARASALRSK